MHMKGKSKGLVTKTDTGYPRKKAGKAPKTHLVFMKGDMCT